MTTGVNSSLTEVENLFYKLVWSPIVVSAQGSLIAAVPFLGWPVISGLTKNLISSLSGYVFGLLRLVIDLNEVQLANTAHQKAYENESEKLLILGKEKGVNSPEYQGALNVAKASLSQFTRFGQ